MIVESKKGGREKGVESRVHDEKKKNQKKSKKEKVKEYKVRAGEVTLVVEHLSNKWEALNSSPVPEKKKGKGK
jgi:hypothetical protein